MSPFAITIALKTCDVPHACETANRFAAVWGCRIGIGDGHVVIEGTGDVDEIKHRWRVALLNERLTAGAAAFSGTLLARLVA